MGSPKALIDWGGQPLVAHQAAVLAGLRDVVVVVGAEAERVMGTAPLPAPARYVVHPGWAAGRSTSLEAAAR
ncbi:MAG: nucleotidyltransferase family protein, partial [Deltaproteobacteria bacterium]